MKATWVRHGYLAIAVYLPDGTRKHFVIAREVAHAFIGVRPEGMQINHKNGIKTDNRVENLEYISPSDNLKHAVKMGLKTNN